VGQRDAVPVDQLQRVLGLKAVHDDQRVTQVYRRRGHHQRRGVIPGARQQVDVVRLLARHVVAGQRRTEVRFLDGQLGQRAPNALGSAGGPGRVIHDRAQRAASRQGRRLTIFEFVEAMETRGAADAEDALGRKAGLLDGQAPHVGVPGVGDKDPGLAVLEDVRDLGSNQVEVDRREIDTDLLHRQIDFKRFARVGQHRGDRVAAFEAEG
jgi:hypothetical protein